MTIIRGLVLSGALALAAFVAAPIVVETPAEAAACTTGVYRAGCVGPNGAVVRRRAVVRPVAPVRRVAPARRTVIIR